MNEYHDWVSNKQPVAARYAIGDAVHARGKVIAYTDQPTVVIEEPDGTRVSWLASLCEPIALKAT